MRLHLLALAALRSLAAAQDDASESLAVTTLTGTDRELDNTVPIPTVSDFEASTFGTASVTGILSATGSASLNGTATATSSAEETLTEIVGTPKTSGNGTATSSAPRPTNTQPCNGYPEFCNRKYSNITEVCAHNSPFVRKRNIGANQALGVTQQLNDGIRMLQGQAHLINGTLYYCHSSCDLLNAGTVEDYLREVTEWVEKHPYEVITILFGNYGYQLKGDDGKPLVTASTFAVPIEKSGLKKYIYQPPKTAMTLDDWPTLSDMIFANKRVVTFIDYNFDTNAVPYLLWEFYNMWETPFSPTDPTFPCTLERPGGLSKEKQDNMLYMANHNLNVEISVAGLNLLIPNTVELNITNGVNGSGSLGEMTEQCTADHGRPPNFLLVDYYNEGPFNGSVFEVAARANNVTYKGKCCGSTSMATTTAQPSAVNVALIIAMVAALML